MEKDKHQPPFGRRFRKRDTKNLADTSQWETQADLIATIDGPSLSVTAPTPIISNVEFITSYNWLDTDVPTILVPGSPPVWTPPANISRLQEDHEPVYRDVNAAHYSSRPTSPAVQAIFLMNPSFPTQDIDIFACGNTLGSLLHAARSQDRTFRFYAEMIGKTVFFVRKENSPKEVIKDVRGYGHTFPEAYTRWKDDVKGSVSHQRIIRYEFGGLKCVVKSESDGYYEDLAAESESLTFDNGKRDRPSETDVVSTNEIKPTELLFHPSTSLEDLEMPQDVEAGNLSIVRAGRHIPQCAIFDLKTRMRPREINMAEILPRLWMNQTPNFIVAYHDFGVFKDIRKQDVKSEIRAWEEQHAQDLAKFHALLKRVIEVVQKVGEGVGVEVRRAGTGELEIRELVDVGWRALEGEGRERWKKGRS